VTRFIVSPRAQADLDEIWDYTVKHWGIEQAEFYVLQLDRHQSRGGGASTRPPMRRYSRGLQKISRWIACYFLSADERGN
jgi:plasmid stabilization system protein ParE